MATETEQIMFELELHNGRKKGEAGKCEGGNATVPSGPITDLVVHVPGACGSISGEVHVKLQCRQGVGLAAMLQVQTHKYKLCCASTAHTHCV